MADYKMTFSSNFDQELNSLKEFSPARDNSDVIRRAVALYKYLHQQVALNPEHKVAIIGKDNKVLQVIYPLP